MSFLSILGKIGKVALELDQLAAPIVSQFDPPIGLLMSGLGGVFANKIVQAEQNSPAGNGPQKLQTTIDGIKSNLSGAASTLNITSWSIDENLLVEAVNAQVAAFNSIAKFKSSIKVGS